MNLALLAAAGIAVSYGLATVLQSVGAKSTTSSDGLDPGLLVRLLRSVPYLVGLALDGAGFLLTVVALQSLPLFVVEAFTAGALAVTAVAAAMWLKIPLSRGEWIGVGGGRAGLVALASQPVPTRRSPWTPGRSGSRWASRWSSCSSPSRRPVSPAGSESPCSAPSRASASAWWASRPARWTAPSA